MTNQNIGAKMFGTCLYFQHFVINSLDLNAFLNKEKSSMLSGFFYFGMFLRNKNSAFQIYASVPICPICFPFYATNPGICGEITLGTEADAWHL